MRTKFSGLILGRRVGSPVPALTLIAQSKSKRRPGPVDGAYVLIDQSHAPPRARYVAWINLFDIEHAARRQRGWQLVDPPVHYTEIVEWMPYGWGDVTLPSVADT